MKGDIGNQGNQGNQGSTGNQGNQGPSDTITIGSQTVTVTTIIITNISFDVVRLTGTPPGAITIDGISAGTSGQILYVSNETGQSATFLNDGISYGGSALSSERIKTPDGADYTILTNSAAYFIYNGTIQKWQKL